MTAQHWYQGCLQNPFGMQVIWVYRALNATMLRLSICTALSTRIKDAGIAIRHSRGYIISILQGPEMGWRVNAAVPNDGNRHNLTYMHPKKSRVKEISENCQIWSTRWQQGAFNSIPAFIERELAKK